MWWFCQRLMVPFCTNTRWISWTRRTKMVRTGDKLMNLNIFYFWIDWLSLFWLLLENVFNTYYWTQTSFEVIHILEFRPAGSSPVLSLSCILTSLFCIWLPLVFKVGLGLGCQYELRHQVKTNITKIQHVGLKLPARQQ